MNRIAFDFGFLQIYWYSIFIILGMLIATTVIYFEAKKREIDLDFLTNLIFNTIIIGIIGARLYYVLFNLNYYLANPIEILEIWNGGLAIHGGLIFGFLYVLFSSYKNKVDLLRLLDILVVGVIIGQAIGRWGNFFNGEAYGPITTISHLKSLGIPQFIINGMYIDSNYHIPTFFYESVWDLIGFIGLLIYRRYPYIKIGQITGSYLIWYSIGRFIIEGFRTDSLMLGSIKMAQLVSILLIIIGIIIYIYYTRIKKVAQLDYLYNKNPEKIKKKQELFIKQDN